MFEVGISKVKFAQVSLLVHALSILNFDGLYKREVEMLSALTWVGVGAGL